MISISVCIDGNSGEIINGPELTTNGFIYVKENAVFIEEMKAKASKIIRESVSSGITDVNVLKTKLKENMKNYLFQKTKRQPMIIPIIMKVWG